MARSNEFYDEFWSGKIVKRPTLIKMLHMQKAGGTFLSKYFKKIVKSQNFPFYKFEYYNCVKHCLKLDNYIDGNHVYYNDENNQTICITIGGKDIPDPTATWGYDISGETLYVTHLCEPINKANSKFKYSRQFKCKV